ncbi:MAG: MFS transporter [Dehalococcoidia bacterium]
MSSDASPSPSPARAPRLFFGWWIVAVCSLVQGMQNALLQQAYGGYVVLLGQEFGWSKAILSWGSTEQQAVYGATGPGVGWLLDRFGPRSVIRVGMLITGASFFLFARVDSLWTFFFSLFVMSIGANMIGYISTTFVVIQWFERRRSTALSLASSGIALGGVAFILVAVLLERVGWRMTADITGLIFVLSAWPITMLMHRRPEDVGLQADGGPAAPTERTPSMAGVSTVDFTLREAMRTGVFWWISFGHGSALFVVAAVNVHLVSALTLEQGFSISTASAIVVLVTAMYGVGTITGGFIGDRGNRQSITMLCMFMHGAAMLLLAHAVNTPMVIAFALLHGYAWGWRGPQMAALRADYFGRGSFGKIMGVSNIIIIIGTMFGPLIAGYAYDLTGSYRVGFDMLAGIAFVGSVFFYLSSPPAPPRRDERASVPVEA